MGSIALCQDQHRHCAAPPRYGHAPRPDRANMSVLFASWRDPILGVGQVPEPKALDQSGRTSLLQRSRVLSGKKTGGGNDPHLATKGNGQWRISSSSAMKRAARANRPCRCMWRRP
ncbi:hypothetical protein RV134_260502 [Roseovarius sp. EC-HK134]|nr:hypothetical protein RV134_260502 [Roseovarius sp. EC-HK134]VVT12107.1 hypothetical protein RV420_290717 [Roseovarius sp. EC-SD190]